MVKLWDYYTLIYSQWTWFWPIFVFCNNSGISQPNLMFNTAFFPHWSVDSVTHLNFENPSQIMIKVYISNLVILANKLRGGRKNKEFLVLLRSCLGLEVFSVAYIRCVLWQYDMLLIKCISPPMFPAECVVLSVQRDNLSMDNLCVVPVYSGTTYLWRPSRGAATCPVPGWAVHLSWLSCMRVLGSGRRS